MNFTKDWFGKYGKEHFREDKPMRKVVDAFILLGVIPFIPLILLMALIGLLWDMQFNGGKGIAKEWHRGVKI